MSDQVLLTRVVCGAYAENAYLYGAPNRDDLIVIDPGDGLTALRSAIASSGRKLGAVLLTHGHFDHTLAAESLQREHGCPLYIHALDMPMLTDADSSAYNPIISALPMPTALAAETYPVQDGEALNVCGMELQLLHTPGHTPGSVCLLDESRGLLFSGDTLFSMACGRTDLPGGDDQQMRLSLRRLAALEEGIMVLPGHGEHTSIGRERRWMEAFS